MNDPLQMAAVVSHGAAALKRKKVTHERIREVWDARAMITYKDARHVPPSEVTAAFQEVEQEAEYTIAGKNKHVMT